MAITTGSFTIGTSADYATVALFASDFGTQTGEITGTLISDTTETALADFNQETSLNDFTLNSNLSHGGNVTLGRTVNIAHSSHGLNYGHAGGAFGVINGFTLKRTVNGSSAARYLINAALSNRRIFPQQMWIHGNNLTGGGARVARSSKGGSMIAWDCSGIGLFFPSNSTTLENMGSFNNGTGIDCSSNSPTIKQMWAFDNTTDFENIASATGINLASSDATAFGTDPNINLTTADEILTDDTENGFGRPLGTSTIINSGGAPVNFTTDMAEDTFEAPYPIGAFESVLSTSGTSFGVMLSRWARHRHNKK